MPAGSIVCNPAVRRRTRETAAARLWNPSTAGGRRQEEEDRGLGRPASIHEFAAQFDARRECLVSLWMNGDVAYAAERWLGR